jgi:hypothetical protein
MVKKEYLLAPPIYLPTIGGKGINKRQKAELSKCLISKAVSLAQHFHH